MYNVDEVTDWPKDTANALQVGMTVGGRETRTGRDIEGVGVRRYVSGQNATRRTQGSGHGQPCLEPWVQSPQCAER